MNDMKQALTILKTEIAQDFREWHSRSEYAREDDFERMYRSLSIEKGRKYYKIIRTDNQTMVWGFVVREDDKQFRAGDILKAASWAAPARNKARGNILDGDFSWVRWTGPEYL